MDIKNWKLKRKQLKAMSLEENNSYFIRLPFHCPKCHWGCDDLTAYTTHLINHLTKKKRSK